MILKGLIGAGIGTGIFMLGLFIGYRYGCIETMTFLMASMGSGGH